MALGLENIKVQHTISPELQETLYSLAVAYAFVKIASFFFGKK